jgi:hypothetical protein
MTTAADRAGAGDRPGGDADITLRVATPTYVTVIAIYVALAAYAAYNFMNDPATDWRGTAVVLAVLAVFLVYFIARLRLTVSGGVLRYRNVLGERTLPLADIVRTEFKRRPFASDPRPILLITSGSRAKQLQVNLMPFRRDDIARFLAMPALKLEKGENTP